MTASTNKQKGRLPLLRWLRKGRNPVVLGFALAVLLFINLRVFRESATLERWEGIAHDARFKMRGNIPHSQDIAIVGITTSSFTQFDLAPLAEKHEAVRMMRDSAEWPWPRAIHARVIDRLFALGARSVAVDIAFPSSRAGDGELAAVVKKYRGRVVLATLVQDSALEDGRRAVSILPPTPALAEAAGDGGTGVVVYHADEDTITRRFDFRTSELREAGLQDDARDLPYFSTRAVEVFGVFGGKLLLSDRYREVINFCGPPRTFPYLPVEDIFDDERLAQHARGGNALRDKLVFYGPIAEVLRDIHATPLGKMPGVEIHAHIASSMLRGDYIADVSPLISRLLGFLSTVGSALLVLRLRSPLLQTLSIGALLGLSYFATQLAFNHWAMLFPTTPWVGGGIAVGAFGIVYLFLLAQWEKTQTRKTLDRFTGTRVAEVVMRNAEESDTARRGERRPVAVLFSDIRGFTTWTEQAQPDHLVGQMNEYFSEMFIHIEATGGNLQKFIGDAILAVWGDTERTTPESDAARAIRTMLAMRPALEKLNAGWRGRDDRREINIGIGINHGDVVVGEVGAAERREFTVLGDGVNFAARLESATKQFHLDCLVGGSVEALTRDKFVFRQVGNLRVKGKTQPVRIFTPLSDAQTPPPEWLVDYHRAIALHEARHFAEAAALFHDVKRRAGGEDFLCDWYAEKCEAFIAAPPVEWDGAHTLSEK